MGALFCGFQVAIRWTVRIGLLFDVVGAGQNRRDHVVEIMDHIAGQETDRLGFIEAHHFAVDLFRLNRAGNDIGG